MQRRNRPNPALIAGCLLVAITAPLLGGELFEVSKNGERGAPSDSEALIYFMRPAFKGKAVKLWAFADEAPIGVTKGKMYVYGRVPAGRHVFWSRAENVSALELEVEAGKTYFLQQKVRMGGLKARVKLIEISADEAEEMFAKCKLSTLTEAGRSRAEEIVGEKWEVAKEKAAERLGEEEEEET